MHIVLLGDSIFDNAMYVPREACVIEQLTAHLHGRAKASLLAVDGHVVEDVAEQLRRLPADATHLVVSAGGNNGLQSAHVLLSRVSTVRDALAIMNGLRQSFMSVYNNMLDALAATQKPVLICTIYDRIPGLEQPEQAALAMFNEVILRAAAQRQIPVLDLRILLTSPSDFSALSPIEPSSLGGDKLARALTHCLDLHYPSVLPSQHARALPFLNHPFPVDVTATDVKKKTCFLALRWNDRESEVGAEQLSTNWFVCTESSSPDCEFVIFYGDWLHVTPIDNRTWRLNRIVPRPGFKHLLIDLGCNLHFAPELPTPALIKMLCAAKAHVEYQDYFNFCDAYYLHVPEGNAEIATRYMHNFLGYPFQMPTEVHSGGTGIWWKPTHKNNDGIAEADESV